MMPRHQIRLEKLQGHKRDVDLSVSKRYCNLWSLW